MKFTEAKKNAILSYLLEKIGNGEESVSKKVADNFEINQNTVHTYINELIDSGLVKRKSRDCYELVSNCIKYNLSRKKGEIDDEHRAFKKYLFNEINQYAANVIEIWEYAFEEMFNNVIDHSTSEKCIIEIRKDASKTAIWIADDGIGIFDNIRDYFKLHSIEDAVEELFKGKVTTNATYHSGEGIFFTSRMMDEFIIISSGKIFHIDKYDESILFDNPLKNKKGTALYMSLSNESNKAAKDIFDKYADSEGGFEKTSIKLKNIYDSSPISRSQAKRLCAGLDKFSEVELDFTDMEWMGQGFAHQIFKVWAKAHPEVRIVPKGMNKDVQKMYNHVVKTTRN